jgi:phospholipase/carboxylesterase
MPPRAGGPPRQLIVLLHGVGADGNDLIELAPVLAAKLPNAAFVAPNAPEA